MAIAKSKKIVEPETPIKKKKFKFPKLEPNQVVVTNKAWYPEHVVNMDKVKKNYIIYRYEERGCDACTDYRQERHSYICDTCPAFKGKYKLFERKKIHGKPYIGLHTGDRLNHVKKAGLSPFVMDNVLDLRSAPKLGYKISFTGKLRSHQKDALSQLADNNDYGQLMAPPRSGKCLVPGTLVQTDSGLVKIEELVGEIPFDTPIEKEFKINTKNGLQSTSHVFRSKSKTIKVVTEHGYTIEGTPEHKMWVKSKDGKFSWKELKSLTQEDNLVLNLESYLVDYPLSLNEIIEIEKVVKDVHLREVDLPEILLTNKNASELFIKSLLKGDTIEVFSKETEKQIQILLTNLGVFSIRN